VEENLALQRVANNHTYQTDDQYELLQVVFYVQRV
jgi:hypothetical protein